MISVDIPGIGELCLKAVVLDYNGTIAIWFRGWRKS